MYSDEFDGLRKVIEDAEALALTAKASLPAKVSALRNILTSKEYKHTAYITVRKEVVLPLIDSIYADVSNEEGGISSAVETAENEASTVSKPRSNKCDSPFADFCEKCYLRKRAEDLRVAKETAERLVGLSSVQTYGYPVTRDEAENLLKIITRLH